MSDLEATLVNYINQVRENDDVTNAVLQICYYSCYLLLIDDFMELNDLFLENWTLIVHSSNEIEELTESGEHDRFSFWDSRKCSSIL